MWMWTCKRSLCLKTRIKPSFEGTPLSLPACRLLCSEAAGIWPKPTGNFSISYNPLVHLNTDEIIVQDVGAPNLVAPAAERFKKIVGNLGENAAGGSALVVEMKILDQGAVSDLTLETNESYSLDVTQGDDGGVNVVISADNFFGARHGLETLSQVCCVVSKTSTITLTFSLGDYLR